MKLFNTPELDEKKKKVTVPTATSIKASVSGKANSTVGMPKSTAIQSSISATPKIYDASTSRGALANIYELSTTNPAKGREAYGMFKNLQNDPSSRYFNAYNKPTNQAVYNLNQMGIDTSNIDDQWFENYSWLQNHYITNGTTTTPTKPGKKATAEQKAAYEYYQLDKARGDTDSVRNERDSLQKYLSYQANRNDQNMSNEEIIGSIDWNKYPTLAKARALGKQKTPMELNSSFDLSDDWMEGVLWAARNDGGTGNSERDMAYSVMGVGNQYKRDDAIQAKRTAGDDYAPYSLGMTGKEMNEAGLYFNMPSFDRKWIDDHWQDIRNNGDAIANKHLDNIIQGVDNEEKANAALNKLNQKIEKWASRAGMTPETLQKNIENELTKSEYAILRSMDKSIEYGGKDLLNMGSAVDYRKSDAIARGNELLAKKGQTPTGDDKIADMTNPVKTFAEIENEINELRREESSRIWAENEKNQHGKAQVEPLPNAKPEKPSIAPAINYRDIDADRRLYDARYGPGAYDRDMEAANNIYVREKSGQEMNEDMMNAKAQAAADAMFGALTDKERKIYEKLPGLQGGRIADGFYQTKQSVLAGPIAQGVGTDKWIIDQATKTAQKIENAYISTVVGTLETRNNYEQLQKERAELQDALDKIVSESADAMLSLENIPEVVAVPAGQNTDLSLNIVRNEDGEYVLDPYFDFENPAVDEYLVMNGLTVDDLIKQAEEAAQRITDNVNRIEEARKKYPVLSDDEIAKVKEASKEEQRLRALIQDKDNQLVSEMDAYNAAVNDVNQAEAKRNRLNNRLFRLTGMSLNGAVVDADMDYISSFANATVPEPEPESFVRELELEYRMSDYTEYDEKELLTHIDELTNEAADIRFELSRYESLPANYQKKMSGIADYLEKQARLYQDLVDIRKDKNYEELVEKGREDFARSAVLGKEGIGMDKMGFAQMNDSEANIYFALYAKYGIERADQFYKDIEDSLLARTEQNIQAGAQELAESGFGGRVLNEFVSIGLAPVEVLAGLYNMVDTAVNGENANQWIRLPSKAAKAASGAVTEAINKTYGKDTLLGQAINGFYEILNNRGRSAMTAASFGWLFPAGTNEIIQAMPIGITAAVDTLNEALDNGAEPWQAWALAFTTFAAETVTEGIELDHMKAAFSGGVNLGRYRDFFKSLIPEAMSEVLGETTNDIVERAFNTWIMGEKSDRAKEIQAYIDEGYMPDEAELMVMRDEFTGVLHTALISAISPGADVAAFTAGKIASYQDYARQARIINRGAESKVTVRDLRNGDIQAIQGREEIRRRREQEEVNRELRPFYDNERQEAEAAAPSINPAIASEEVQKAQRDEYDADSIILDNISDADQSTQTSGIASVLQLDGKDAIRSGAAAANIDNAFGEGKDSIEEMQTLITGGQEAGINSKSLKLGIQYASLADGSCRQVINSAAYQNGTPAQKASLLARAVQMDAKNQIVQAQVNASVHEYRVAEEEQRLMAEGLGDAAVQADQKAADARRNALNAAGTLETQQNVEATVANAVQEAGNAVAQDANQDNLNQMSHAVAELDNQTKVTQEYEQMNEKAQNDSRQAETDAEQVKNETMANIRQQAEANVAQQEQAEADQRAIDEENARIAAEEQARLQAEEDERTGKAWENRRDDLIEGILDNEYLEEGERREARRKELEERANLIRAGKINMAGMMNNTEGLLAVGILGRQLGVNVKITNDESILPKGAAGLYENGTVYLNENMIQEGKMTVGQAVMEVALHEFTHYMEGTKQYDKYSQTVLDFLFQGADAQARLNAAIDSKIQDYREKFGQELTVEKARAEIVADFAKNRLNDRDVVQRFIDNGLAGRVRNALHNINQAIKNFRLTGTERETAEYLRRTERLYQKMITDAARASTHPDGGQFSLAQLAESTGLGFDQNTLELRMPDGRLVDGVSVNHKITPEMLNNTPVGMLISLAENGMKNKKGKSILPSTISKETADAQRKMFADLANMVAQYKDSDLVWEIASSTLFSAMKSNSDPQYSTTVDFGTICAKTQEIINVMSQVMLEKGRGLTREEVLKVYNETADAGLTVPCPVCYVFSRWMGVPSLLGQMSQYQKQFVVLNEDGSINEKETQKVASKYVKDALDKYGNKANIDKAKASVVNRMKTQEKNRTSALAVLNSETATEEEKAAAQTKHDEAIAKLDELQKDLGEVEAYNWVTQALLDEKGKVDSNFELTPDEVLFDLRRTGDFAKYTKNWTYRNTRGAGMGKAIMPYSGETIGDIIYGTNRKMASANPFLTLDPQTAAKGIKYAIARAVKQNLIGGQRLQSTSDFRPEWGLDYLMSFLELQAIGSKVQMYTKVAEAVPLLASMGADINLSIMGKGKGWHVDENGNYALDFSDVTGMNYETAKALKDEYSNVQMILVGMNDTHIRLALADSDIDFVIPWHASGNSKDTLSSLVSSASKGKEQLETSSDYTDTQSDAVSDNQTADQKRLWNLRMKILMGKKINAEERDTIYTDKYLAPLYERFNTEGKDPDCYKVKLGKDQAKQIFPYEYWNKGLTKEQADENGRLFVDYCLHFGLTPRFSGTVRSAEEGKFFTEEEIGDGKPIAYDENGHVIRFEQNNFAGAVYDENGNITGYDPEKMDKGYWKVLIDRPMYDNDGNYRDQQVVDVTKAKIGSLENGKLVNSDMPLTTSAMYGPNYSEQEKNAVDMSLAAIEEHSDLKAGQYSDGGTSLTDLGSIQDVEKDYQDAIDRGDMEAAQEDVDFYAEQKGYTDEAFHGTKSFGFTKFNLKAGSGLIFVSYDRDLASTYTENGDVREIGTSVNNNMKFKTDFTDQELMDHVMGPLADETRASGTDIINVRKTGENEFTATVEYVGFNGETKQDEIQFTRNDIVSDYQKRQIESGETEQGIYHLYTRPGNQLVIDADGAVYGNITVPWTDKKLTTGEIAEYARQNGYDSVRINNLRDGGDNNSAEKGIGDVGIFFNQDDVKSADPVTYDDQGKPISLDQRFTDNPDIRYSDGGASLTDLGNPEYMKPFAEQLHDFAPKTTRQEIFKNDSLLVGATPELLRQIGLPALPVVINQEHVGYALDGTYPKEKFRAGHTFAEEEFAKLPQKIADPVAITYDSQRPNNLVIYIDMINTEGDKVVTPVAIGEERNIGGKEYNTNALRTVYEQENGAEMIASAIKKDSNNRHTLFYLNKEKALGLSLPHDIKAIVQNAPSGINHIINAPGSLVNTEIKDQTDSSQFKKWFKKSKITNPDGSPMIVYHGTTEDFTAFDMSKGRSTMDIQGAFFSPWEEDSAGYGDKVGAFYLSIKNPANEAQAYKALNMFKGQNEAGKKAREYLIRQGYDGVINGVKGHPEEFIAFYPTQIKSATDNIGMFDGSNPDYRYSDGGTSLTELDQQLVGSGIISQEDLDAFNGNLPGQPTTEGGSAQRQFGHQTAQESDALHEEVKQYLYTHSDYTPDTNSSQINRSMDWVRNMANENDPDGYYAAVNAVTDPNFDYRSADGQARMLTVMGMAALKGDTETELRIADAYNQQGTDLGRQLQARKMFRLMTPIGRRTILQQEVARINQDYKNSGKNTEVQLSEATLKAAEAAQTEEDFEKVQRTAEKELAEQMPANWKDRLRTWRMMSMLANPRTHIRNILGNWIFQPVVGLKNAIGAGLESAFVKDGNRTKAIRYTDDAKAFAKQDVLAMKDTLTGEAKYSPESKIEQNKKAFGQGKGLLSRTVGKAVQGIADFNSNMLEKEDWIFLNKHYRNALASYMTANGLTSADMTGQTLEAARTYAVLEAQKATYRDANAVSSWLNTMSRKGGIGGFLVDTVLPFKKTPANILRRGIEYSPVGLLKSFATAKRSLDLYAAWEDNGKRGDMPKGAKPLTEVLDNIAAGLTGTGIAALGALGYALGAIKLGFGGDPDDELEEERGGQEYSIELFGHSFTIDWAAPVCMPFFTGAALFKEFSEAGDVKDAEDAAELFGRFINSLSSISEPIFNLSMLDGVSSLLKSTSYSNQNEIPVFELLQNIGANYVSSFVPSALGAAARTIDTTRRKSYVESGDPLRIWKQKIEQAQNKIPFLSMRNIPYRNVWGEADVSGAGEAFLENFLLPGYLNRLSDDKLTNELQRIYDTTKDASVIPKVASKTVGDIKLNDQQYDQYVVTRGQTAKALLNDLIGRDEFMTLTPTDVSQGNPEAQVQLIKDVWTYANAIARHEIDPSYKMVNWVAEAYAGGNVIDSILEREEGKAQEEYNKQSKDDLFTAISEQDAEAINTSLEAMRQSGSDDKKIREDVMNQYRDQYKKAYAEGDTETMNAIKYGMLYLDLGDSSFTDPEDDKNSIFNKWENAVDKEK